MSQTTVSSGGQSIGVAGQIADSQEGRDTVSGFSKEPAGTQIPFGFGVRVQPGSNGDGFLLATGFSNIGLGFDVAGVNTFDFNHARAGVADSAGNFSGDLGASGLLPNASLQVTRRGRILVPVEINVVAGDRAWCRGVGTGALTPGSWAGTGYNVTTNGSSYMLDVTRLGVFRSGTYTAADGTTKVAILDCDFTGRPY